jgi:hypothetical protein
MLHNYGEKLHYSHPSVFLTFFNEKTLDYRVDNQAFVGFRDTSVKMPFFYVFLREKGVLKSLIKHFPK